MEKERKMVKKTAARTKAKRKAREWRLHVWSKKQGGYVTVDAAYCDSEDDLDVEHVWVREILPRRAAGRGRT